MKKQSKHNERIARAMAIAAMACAIVAGSLASAVPSIAAPPDAHAGSKATGGGEERTKGDLVNINTADAETLGTLPGVGPSLAQRIIDYRKEHGPFKAVDELLNVRGIGDRSLARFRERLTVGGRG